MRRVMWAVSAFWAVLTAQGAMAVPVLVEYERIPRFTFDDFERVEPGGFSSPGVFDAFSFDAVDPRIADIETLCRSAGQCLTADDLLPDGIRTFSGFRQGTLSLGVRLGFVNPDQLATLSVEVVGRQSRRVFTGFGGDDPVAFLGFQDTEGLRSVSFRIGGDLEGPDGPFRTNYAFDDVKTWVRPIAPVPLPGAGWLMGGTLLGLAVMRRRTRRANAVRRRGVWRG